VSFKNRKMRETNGDTITRGKKKNGPRKLLKLGSSDKSPSAPPPKKNQIPRKGRHAYPEAGKAVANARKGIR
jgi:hypothetical protein